MATAKPQEYGNESISQLKGADRVRKRPGVIFGSDGLEGCEHAVFEILSNSIDEAREGFGNIITVTLYDDKSIEVEDFGRGCPVDWNPAEKRFNWELVYCELYAGGKYKNDDGGDYEYSLGLNGLGACATQYASEYMDVTVWRDGNKYTLHFAKGKIKGKMLVEPSDRKKTGTTTRWKPDIEVFTDINIPEELLSRYLAPPGRRERRGDVPLPRDSTAQSLKRRSSATKTALRTMSRSWRGRALSHSPITSRPRERARTARISPNTRCACRRRSVFPTGRTPLSITTTPRGSSTAARRTPRPRPRSFTRSTLTLKKPTSIRKMRARSPSRILPTA